MAYLIPNDDLIIIKKKLKLTGWGSKGILGYISGENYYKVKLKEDGGYSLLTMEKEGRIIHILTDKTKGVK
tara:strand:- start:1237 stop:1449 length:213 start_codon:yes stop_codon:yes gene_type:complete